MTYEIIDHDGGSYGLIQVDIPPDEMRSLYNEYSENFNYGFIDIKELRDFLAEKTSKKVSLLHSIAMQL